MVLKLLSNGRWRNLETGRFATAPVEISPGKFVNAEGEPVQVKLPSYMTVTQEYRAARAIPQTAAYRAAVETPSPNIISGEKFIERYKLPELETTISKANTFKRGVANMAVVKSAPFSKQRKIRMMDSNKLLQLYKEDNTIFDLYFAYEGESLYHDYTNEEYDIVDTLIDVYERKYGAIK